MRRASALTLLAAIGFSLIGPVVLLDAETSLPACCRRNGAHHCAMSADQPERRQGVSLAAVPSRCSAYPGTITAPGYPGAALPGPAPAIFAAIVSHPSVAIQTESRYRVSFSRCRQKRGPPSLLS